MSDLHDLSAIEQGAAIAAGEVGRAALVEHYLARIGRLAVPGQDRLGAFVTLTEERARLAATAPLPSTAAGPLAGVPTAVKDLDPIAGVRTTFGSPVFADFVPEVSDEVSLRIDRAGMPVLGKTSTPELGSPCYTEPEGLAPAVTPYDLTRMAGGSSGGAAVAVAAGLVPVAQGSDGGGSIRIPASCCGLVGLKPSRGVVSGAPTYGDPIGLATAGALARSVRDAAALLDVLAGRAVGDPTWRTVPSLLEACERPPGRLRIARFIAPVISDVPVDPECVTAWEDASAVLVGLGHDVEDVEVPLPPEAVPVFEVCWAVLTALTPVPTNRRHLLRPLTRWLMARGDAVSAPDFGRAIGELRRLAASALKRLAPYDAVLTPTLAAPPLPVGAIRDDADPAADFEAQKRFTPWTSAWNVTGMPAASLPTHWTPDGLPVGVMLAGRPGEDALLVSLCAQVEEAAASSGIAWADRHPPAWTD